MHDYLAFFLEYIEASPLGFVSLFLLMLFRIGPIVNQASFFGAKLAPANVRVAIAVAIAFILLPIVMLQTKREVLFDAHFIAIGMKEILIGVVLGFLTTFPFLVAQSTGILIDFVRGASIMQQQDPTMQTSASPIGILYNYVIIYVFYQLDGPFIFLSALADSYHMLPVDHFMHATIFSKQLPLWQAMFNLMNNLMSLAIQFAAPSLLAVLMAETFLGIANRLAPQVQIVFLGMSLKSLLGLFLLWASWTFVVKQMGKFSVDWMSQIKHFLETLTFTVG